MKYAKALRSRAAKLGVAGAGLLAAASASAATATVDWSSVATRAQTDITATITTVLPVIAATVGLGVALKVGKRMFGKA